MEDLLIDILMAIRAGDGSNANPDGNATTAAGAPHALSADEVGRIVRAHNEGRGTPERPAFAKKQLLPFYQRVKREEPARWRSWGIDEATEAVLVQTLRMKPGRTASGVATVTVLTKPWPCSGACTYCPNDVRMPKSYLADEPACQRAERCWFDPYLQVAARLSTLSAMGHTIDKVELIVLGGTWDDYPATYQTWFVCRLFDALNDDETTRQRTVEELQARHRALGMAETPDEVVAFTRDAQRAVTERELTYNEAVTRLYGDDPAWRAITAEQRADDAELARGQRRNETAAHRCVGLVMETRPDAVSAASLSRLRRLGCTKVQMGIQSLDGAVLEASGRWASRADIARAFELLRLFGFKTHVHIMVNLPGSSPEQDEFEYRELVESPLFSPDEVKLYPCVLVEGARLQRTDWHPYSEETLLDVLAADVAATPPYTRISRMIRDIPSDDILAGNKKTNLRETVDARLATAGTPVVEMRHREVRGEAVDASALSLSVIAYPTTVSKEYFLQWTTPEDRLAGFLRLSLPDASCVRARTDKLPVAPGEAMIREVHVYGRVAALQAAGQNAQHLGLGRSLVARACEIARA